jgi:plastocyanin
MKNVLSMAVVLLLCPAYASAGTITGKITSSKEALPESQTACVVWVEGPPATTTPESKPPVMSQSGVQFLPRVLTVVAGQTVAFPNEDDVAHNVFSMSSAKKFKLGIYPKGDSREVTFEKPGVIDLFCSIHRHMHAVIVVTPNEFATQSAVGEMFAIENVPAGEYVVKGWNAAHKLVEVKVLVPAEGAVESPVAFVE